MSGKDKKRAGSKPSCGLGFLTAGGSLIHPVTVCNGWRITQEDVLAVRVTRQLVARQDQSPSLLSCISALQALERSCLKRGKFRQGAAQSLSAPDPSLSLHPLHRQPQSLGQGERPHAEPRCAQAEPLSPDAKVVKFLHRACLRDSTRTTWDICVRAQFGWKISWLLDPT